MRSVVLGPRRRRRSGKTVTMPAAILAASSMQGCCDPAVATETSSGGESSTTSADGLTEPTGDPALPEWAIGSFSDAFDEVGMSFMVYIYGWVNLEITATGMLFLDWYSCSVHQERQEFRWTSTDGGQSLTLQPVPPADVFTFGNGSQVSEVVIEPGDSCDTIVVRYFHVDAMTWVVSEFQRGNVCARATGSDACTFTFEWCDGVPPPACD